MSVETGAHEVVYLDDSPRSLVLPDSSESRAEEQPRPQDVREPLAESCCSRWCGALACSDSHLLDPVMRKPFATDAASLICSQDGCEENAREICLAISGSPEPRQAFSEVQDNYMMLETLAQANGNVPVVPESLKVPSTFRGLRYDWSAPSSSQAIWEAEEINDLKDCLTAFVEAMLRGVIVQLRVDDEELDELPAGRNLHAIVAFTSSLQDLVIATGGLERGVPMNCIRWVRPLEKGRRTRSWFPANDRRKMVLIGLAGDCFLRFRFEYEEQAAYFGTCMRLLAKASYTDSLLA